MKSNTGALVTALIAVCSALPTSDYQPTYEPRWNESVGIENSNADFVSSCGPDWMAVDDVFTNNGAIHRRGYNTAVDGFCDMAHGKLVGAENQKYLSMATRVWLSGGGRPEEYGINGYVYFEVHNKINGGHTVDGTKCKEYLKKMTSNSVNGKHCYGGPQPQGSHATLGGTWQVGSNDISYHAIANKIPPINEQIDNVVLTHDAIYDIGRDHGPFLSPWPLHQFNDAVPVNCHSHNDYMRDKALYSALMAGCVSVEADVWPHGDKLTVGHEDPGPNGPTLDDLYLKPLLALIQSQDAIFTKKPEVGLDLLVDFKSDPDKTWDLLIKTLAPLRDAGYLSSWHHGAFDYQHVTVIASGTALVDGPAPEPLAKANSDTANPAHAVFVDARANKPLRNFNQSNTYWMSASFKEAVQRDPGPLTPYNLGVMRAHVRNAHARRFKIRYWDIPDEGVWQHLVAEGVDRLNVDHLESVAGLDWYL
ncbi:hypothetical protein BDV96DRAFT_639767 [Lophiotrema nucula]|uniref:Altered inheritance of mitochondria protein 6 n=1 Tax=Lophiotrema nucula TaxID=690887 RepID=A0A6A5ZWT0_9PLEO|nr:hypothetical protein BDV96DRAFT_639767 [Lophiotrema nucula]